MFSGRYSYSVNGDIVTDGTIGTPNVVGWDLLINAPTPLGSLELSSTSGDSTFQTQASAGNLFSATATSLQYNFSNGGGIYFQGTLNPNAGVVDSQNPQFVLGFQGGANQSQVGPAGIGIAVYGYSASGNSQLLPTSGLQTIASTTLSSVPLPSAVLLFGSALAGLRLFGQRRKLNLA